MLNKKSVVRTRFAPSPTGVLHIGSIWMALFNWLWARHNEGVFILRIEDTDRARLVDGAEKNIFEALSWYGLNYDEGPDVGGQFGPYRQSERLSIYQTYADGLIKNGKAYWCFCSPERLAKLRQEQEKKGELIGYDGCCRNLDKDEANKRRASGEPAVVRMKFPKSGVTRFNDLIRGEIVFKNELIDDQVLLKSDGWPTYHLAAVVDDHLMEISPVIRAEEWLASTPKQLALFEALGWEAPRYAHLPLILGSDRAKLSKRHMSSDALSFRSEGYLPEAIINYLALLGWNPKNTQEIFSRPELTKSFSLAQINKAGAIFDRQKLDWFNKHYIKELLPHKFLELSKAYISSPNDRAILMLQERITKFGDLAPALADIIEVSEYDADLLPWKKLKDETRYLETKKRLNKIIELIGRIAEENFIADEIEKSIKTSIEKDELGVGETLWPMRVALTGKKESAGPFEVAGVIGKEESLRRLNVAVEKLERIIKSNG